MSDVLTKHKRAEKEYKSGIKFIDTKNYHVAAEYFKKAHELDPENPVYLSYYGFSIAFSEGNPRVGIELCNRAIKRDDSNPDFYLNLGMIYSKTKDRNNAMQTFKEGLKYDNDNKKLLDAFEKIGQRKSSALPFLSRNNLVNVYCGRLKAFLIKL